jgi:hypothetical protein
MEIEGKKDTLEVTARTVALELHEYAHGITISARTAIEQITAETHKITMEGEA